MPQGGNEEKLSNYIFFHEKKTPRPEIKITFSRGKGYWHLGYRGYKEILLPGLGLPGLLYRG